MDPAIETLRKRAPANELDYGLVMDCLKGYRNPRNKLSQLVRTGALVRVKKGLYVFGELYRRGPLSMETLANLIYGPSYVSLEWALRFYDMIPEHVAEVTSVTLKRNTVYDTPIGRFSYLHCHPKAYPVGITRHVHSQYQSALIATPEKAVADQLVLRRGKITSNAELKRILLDDLRMEEEDLAELDLAGVQEIYEVRPHSAVEHLLSFLQELQQP